MEQHVDGGQQSFTWVSITSSSSSSPFPLAAPERLSADILFFLDGGPSSAANGHKPTRTAPNTSTTSASALAGREHSTPPTQPLKCSQLPAPNHPAHANKPMRVQVNTLHRTSSSLRCLLKRRSTALRERGVGSTGPGRQNRRHSGAGSLGVQRVSCRRRHMLQTSNAIRLCHLLVIWGRAIGDGGDGGDDGMECACSYLVFLKSALEVSG